MQSKSIPLHRKALAALLAAGLASAVMAQAPAAPLGAEAGHHSRGLPPQLEVLNLSDAQKARIKALHESAKAQHQQQRAAGKALHESLRSLSPGAANYTQEVDRIATEIGQMQAQQIRVRAALRAQEWQLLTPIQQSQWAAMPAPERGRGRHGAEGHRN